MKRLIAKILLLISLAVMPWLQATNAWFLDTEQSVNNRLAASSLDFVLLNDDQSLHHGLFFDEAKLKVGQPTTKSVVVKNIGQMDLNYWPTLEYILASQLACNQIEITASFNGNKVYEGLLTEFDLAANPVEIAQANHQWDFDLSNANENPELYGETCEFSLIFKGFQNPNTLNGFSDTEMLTNKVILAHQPTLVVEYDQNEHLFSYILTNLTSFTALDYRLSYDTDTISDVIVGSQVILGPDPITKTMLLGSCSSENSCTYLPNPHNFELQLDLTDIDGDHLELAHEL